MTQTSRTWRWIRSRTCKTVLNVSSAFVHAFHTNSLVQAFLFNTTWGHRRRNCSPKVEFFPWVMGFFLEFWIFSLNFLVSAWIFFFNFWKITANFQFSAPNILILKILDKNILDSRQKWPKKSYSKWKLSKFEVIFLSFWSREELLPEGWVFFLSGLCFFLEF